MTLQASRIGAHSIWTLWIVIACVYAPSVPADEPVTPISKYEQFCNPPTGPKRPCPRIRPDGPLRPVTPEMKAKILQELEQSEREYLARPKPERVTGIIPGTMVQERFNAGYPFGVDNAWIGTLNGQEVTVYAGAMSYDPGADPIEHFDPQTVHGFVIVQTGQLGSSGSRSDRIYTPTPVGALRITAATGTVLTLQSRQGNKFSLDVATEKLTPLSEH